jgi:hypothetical protein
MTRPIRISVIADADRARKEITSVGTTLKRALGAGIAVAAGAGVKELLGSINRAASDAQQSVGASESVFKQYADTVIERSKSAADSVGLSANEYRELANVSGAMLKNAGTPLKQVTDLTAKLTRRAADLAATYGGTTRDAIESVNSLLRGEADPIERYGVSIKQSDISARLAAKGLDKLTGSAKKQAEQQARLELLFQQTKDAAGQFGREADTAQGQQQRFNAELEDAKAAIGTAFLPILTDLTKFARREAVPMLEDFAGWLAENQDEIRSTASELGGHLLPVLETAGDVLGLAVDAAKALPEPLRGIALQAGLAALALPKVSAAATLVTGSIGRTAAGLRDAETRTNALASAAKTAAGIGGMVALAQGADSSNGAVKGLTTTLGAAGVGLAVGGPWGAAVGAAGGLLWSLADAGQDTAAAVGKAGQSAKDSTATWQNYARTLDDVSGAVTKATRAMVIQSLQEHDLLAQANELGLSKRTIVDGILGEKSAREQLAFAIRAQKGEVASEFTAMADANGDLSASEQRLYNDRIAGLLALEKEIGKLKDSTAAKAEEIAILKKIPEAVVTQVQTPGAVKSAADIAALAAQFQLTPKQILTVIKMSGVKASKDEVQGLKRELIETGNVKPKDAWANMFGQGIGKAKKNAQTGTADINRFLLQLGDVDSKVADGKFGKSLRSDMRAMKGDATAGGVGVGDGLGGGMYSRMEMWIGPIRAKGVAMGKAAVDGAKEGAATHSPSRETIWVGRMLGEGLAVGMDRTGRRVQRAGRDMVAAALAGVTGGSSGVDAAIANLTQLIEKTIKGKKQEKREKAVLKSLRDQFQQLRANGAEQDRINGLLGERVEAEASAYDQLRAAKKAYDDYAESIRGTITATGDLTQLGRQDDGSVSLTSLLNQLQDKAIRAERFQDLMRQLADQGLSRAQIDQMLSAGPESALATAEAIAAGGQMAVDEINRLQNRLGAAGDVLGKNMADRYYQQGINIAQGLVAGLESQLAAIQAAAAAIAAALAGTTKKKLKIKSPSRVFKEIGKNVTDGLTIGIDDTRATRAGVSLARGLTSGFGTPALDAVASLSGSSSGQEVTVRVTSEQVSLLQQGREIQMKLDYARSNGVTGTTF